MARLEVLRVEQDRQAMVLMEDAITAHRRLKGVSVHLACWRLLPSVLFSRAVRLLLVRPYQLACSTIGSTVKLCAALLLPPQKCPSSDRSAKSTR
jgi:hypothetical protein